MQSFNEHDFRARVDAALRRIRTVLENTRNPQYPADVSHRYEDKYLLAEFVTRVSVASLVQCLEVIGMTDEQLEQLRTWAKTRSVTVRLAAHEDCRYLREETHKVESPQALVTETRGLLGTKTKTEKVVTTVTEHFWSFDFGYEIVAYQGSEPEKAIKLHARTGSVEIKTGTNTTPRPRTVVRPPLDVNITWLLNQLDAEQRSTFAIDRADKGCHTPRRNRDIDAALRAFEEFYGWCNAATRYFLSELFSAQPAHGRDLNAINANDVFVPVVPLFEAGRGAREGVLPLEYTNSFLAEERRSLTEKCRALSAAFPRDSSAVTAVEAGLLVTLMHASAVCQHLSDAVAYIEDMLRKQLIAAIGKELTPADFTSYMEFHHRKLVKAEYRPQPFSYAIRRPDHYPEGVLSIEADRGGAMPDPIATTVARREAARPMSFALDAATRVSFLGERYLHAWIAHRFSDQGALALSLVARARQFSSFVLLVGRIASADSFEPRHAVIVQNKDVLKIPLMLETIPTPKEFRDAIESLSPEQQRFAKAFRGMQLESTLFGVCVVQIKPQLEKLLKLADDSLTKEIRLTQELLNLFIEYQIPSDLLSYDGPADAPADAKLARVKEYVARMQEMIDLSKKREIEQEREREALRLAEMNLTPVAPPAMYAPPSAGPMGYGGPPPAPPMAAMPMGAPAFGPPPGGGPPVPRSPSPGPGAVMRSAAAPPAPAFAPSTGASPVFAEAAPPPPPPEPARQAVTTTAATKPTSGTAAKQPASTRVDASSAAPGEGASEGGEVVDYTRIPGELDRKFEALDDDAALRATIINPGDPWTRNAQKGLLSSPVESTLRAKEQKDEKNRAFDLLDALTRSGSLPIDDASLHVVIAATHRFDRTLLDTVIQENVNPIEKVERSLMIVGTTIHQLPARELLALDQRDRFFTYTPQLGDGSTSADRREG